MSPFTLSVLATSYSRLSTTIASRGLNCRVRNENGCDPSDKAPEQNFQTQKILSLKTEERHKKKTEKQKRLRDSHISFREFCRGISTPRLHALLRFHLAPINVVISHGPQTIPHLGVGFPLRCFQRLSIPNIATGQSTWR